MPSHRLIVSICFPFRELKNVPDKIVKDGYFRGATLFQGLTPALCEIPAYLRQLTYALRRRLLGNPFTAPSAVHLIISPCECINYFYLRFNGLFLKL